MDDLCKSLARKWLLCAQCFKAMEAWIARLQLTQDHFNQMTIKWQIASYQDLYITLAASVAICILNTKVENCSSLIAAAAMIVHQQTATYKNIQPYLQMFAREIIVVVQKNKEINQQNQISTTWEDSNAVAQKNKEIIQHNHLSTTWADSNLVQCPTCIFHMPRNEYRIHKQCFVCRR
jgi:hypothetical protein